MNGGVEVQMSKGESFFVMPGPSHLPRQVLQAMQVPAYDIYDGAIARRLSKVTDDLAQIAGGGYRAAMYIGNGHAGWDAALLNLFSPGDLLLVLSTGRFGHLWADAARALGYRTRLIDFGGTGAATCAALLGALEADRAGEIRGILVTSTDTSSTVRSDIASLGRVLKDSGHDALLLVDAIASFACESFDTASWGADVIIAASQKGLMAPPGLFFLFIGSRAMERRRERDLVSRYWDWVPRLGREFPYRFFGGTTPIQLVFGLEAALEMILREEGLGPLAARHKTNAEAIHTAISAWAEASDGAVDFFLNDPSVRSEVVTAIGLRSGGADRLFRWCKEEGDLTLGAGLYLDGSRSGLDPTLFRIGHMGYMNAPMVMGALGVIDAGLNHLGYIGHTEALSRAGAVYAASTKPAPARRSAPCGCC